MHSGYRRYLMRRRLIAVVLALVSTLITAAPVFASVTDMS